jgi:hypothetical protein
MKAMTASRERVERANAFRSRFLRGSLALSLLARIPVSRFPMFGDHGSQSGNEERVAFLPFAVLSSILWRQK